MIYPEANGKDSEHLRLGTLESVWIRAQLTMWGRWAVFSISPQAAGIFQRLLSDPAITRKALKDAMRRMNKVWLSIAEFMLYRPMCDELESSYHYSE